MFTGVCKHKTSKNCLKLRSMPAAFAMNTVATPCMIAVPSMLMVAPSGIVKEATELLTPWCFSTVSIVTGSVAFELAVLKAIIAAGRMFSKNLNGLKRARAVSNSEYTPKQWRAKITTMTTKYCNRFKIGLMPC